LKKLLVLVTESSLVPARRETKTDRYGNQSYHPNVNSPDQLAPGGASYNAATNSPHFDTTNLSHYVYSIPTRPTEIKLKQRNDNNDR